MKPPPAPVTGPDLRLTALRRFALAITLLNVLGHAFLGFEQAWANPLVALLAAYAAELLLEAVDARARGRHPRFAGGAKALFHFLLPAHISALAVSMLLYPNERLMPVVFASVVAIASKALFRVAVGNGSRHFLNPSNTGIAVTLILFPWVGMAPPYQFTEELAGWANWILPALIVASGTILNARLTRRLPLIASWLGFFALQGWLRSLLFDTSVAATLMPMTGVAFLLFTYYMITDPATTPGDPRRQVVFGAAVAAVYALFMLAHMVFGIFFALLVVCSARGLLLAIRARLAERAPAASALPGSTVPGRVGG